MFSLYILSGKNSDKFNEKLSGIKKKRPENGLFLASVIVGKSKHLKHDLIW